MTHEEAVASLAVEGYVLNLLTPAERDAFETHSFECVDCADELRLAAVFLANARSLFEPDRTDRATR